MLKNTLWNMIRPGYAEQETEKQEEQNQQPTMETRRKNLTLEDNNYPSVNYNLMNSGIFTDETQQAKFAEPVTIEDAEAVVEAIKAGKMVILFLDNAEKGQEQRILDFINGYAYAYGIQPKPMKNEKQWIIDPLQKRTKTNYR